MPAALLTAVRRIEVREVPAPEPGPDEVLVELSAIGICGSDRHYWRHGRIGDTVVKFPFLLGHEPAGRVTALGRGVRGPEEGQRVAVEPGISCGRCEQCLRGRGNLCHHVRFLGSPPVAGAFQRFLKMPAECVLPLPPGVDEALGSAAEPLGIALHTYHLVNLRPAETVAIIGGGPIGLGAAALARRLGARAVALSEPRPARRQAAQALGVERVTSEAPEEFLAAVKAATAGDGAEVVLECCGEPGALDLAVNAAARGGRVGFVAIPEVDSVQVNPHEWRRRELDVVNVRRSNRTLHRCLALLAEGDMGLKAAGFFSQTVGLAGLQGTFEALEDEGSPLVKVVLDARL